MSEKDTDAQEVNQGAPYLDPPGLETRLPATFEPVTLVAYLSRGGREVWRQKIRSEMEYSGQLTAVQQELERGLLSRVDILRMDSTELLGSLIAHGETAARFRKYA